MGEGNNLSPEFAEIVVKLSEEAGHPISRLVAGEEAGWVMEVSSVMRDTGCPHNCLVEGEVAARLAQPRARLLVLHCLATEVMVARMEKAASKEDEKQDSTSDSLTSLLATLGLGGESVESPGEALFKAKFKLGQLVSKAPKELLSSPALTSKLAEKDWKEVSKVQAEMSQEYALRRRMLLARLDATVQSFAWSDRMVGKQGEIGAMYRERREGMGDTPNVDLVDLVAAREDVAIVEKVRLNTKAEKPNKVKLIVSKPMLTKHPLLFIGQRCVGKMQYT